MRKIILFFLICVISFLTYAISPCVSFAQTSEDITITTYYPSPYGVYNEMAVTSRQAIGDLNGDGAYTNADMAVDQFGAPIPGSLTVAGNVGIGTTTPSSKLVIAGDNVNTDRILIGDTSAMSIGEFRTDFGNSRMIEASSGLGFRAASLGSYHMFINTNGNIGIGTTTPSQLFSVGSGNAFQINNAGDIVVTGGENTTWGLYDQDGHVIIHWDDSFDHMGIAGSADSAFTLRVYGSINSDNWPSSDIRFKDNLEDITGALEKIKKIRGVKFDWRADEFPQMNFSKKKQIGIIAQEAENEFPELVMEDGQGYKSFSYEKFTAVLLEAVKEQQDEIESLKKEIEGLKE